MILLNPRELVPGQVVARDVFNPSMPQTILLRAGHVLTQKTIAALERCHTGGVWVRDDNLALIDALIPLDAEKALSELAIQSYALWTAMERDPEASLPVEPFGVMVEDALALMRRMELAVFPWVNGFSGEVFFGVHPAYVCLLALALERRVEKYVESEFPGDSSQRRVAFLLGLGTLLHDIGNLQVPRHLLMNVEPLSPSELEEVRLHTEHGYKMLHDAAGPHVALTALHHHQSYDGSGYPKRRSGDDDKPLAGHRIPVLARIAGLADIYVTLTSERPYSGAMQSFQALEIVRSKSGAVFDPVLVQALIEIVPPFLPGRRVLLSNGFQAVVIGTTPERAERPIVRTIIDPKGGWLTENRREDIALALHTDVAIAAYEGTPLGTNPATGGSQEAEERGRQRDGMVPGGDSRQSGRK